MNDFRFLLFILGLWGLCTFVYWLMSGAGPFSEFDIIGGALISGILAVGMEKMNRD